uniref:Protein FAM32A n=1 Tax=Prolemur simus TaxID=1328070 RepID=A0A8C9A1L3_PROSS
MEAYEQVQKGPLKLKGVAELGVTKRKKKKKAKDKAKLLEAMGTSKKNEEEKRRGLDKRTPAQVAFEKMQEKRQGHQTSCTVAGFQAHEARVARLSYGFSPELALHSVELAKSKASCVCGLGTA